MIAKHVPMRAPEKSSFCKLIEYLNNPQSKQERVGGIIVTNCLQDNVLDAALEIQATQALNTRTDDDKTYHLILSLRERENPPLEVLEAVESRVCSALGYQDHQRISVIHHDTDNLHLHIAINKIHPKRYTIHTPYRDYKILSDICEKVEQEYRLEVDNHISRKTKSENRVDDMERHTGIESLLSWIKRECAEQMIAAQNWAELNEVMRQNGLELRERTNGLVITDGTDICVKASSVARMLSKGNLEKRFGTFEANTGQSFSSDVTKMWSEHAPLIEKVGSKPPPHSKNRLHNLSDLQALKIDNSQSYDQRPIFCKNINTTELYAKYKMEQQDLGIVRKDTIAQTRIRKERLIEVAKHTGYLKRLAIKMLKGPGVHKKLLYALASKSLHKDIANINACYLKERNIAYTTHLRQPWADWLKTKAIDGDNDALTALRAREARQYQFSNTVKGLKTRCSGPVPGLKPDNVTKGGTIIYRVGSTAIRDDGDVLNVSRGAADQGLEAALRMAIHRYGDHITINGSDAFKERIVQVALTLKLHITFDNPVLELHRQHLEEATVLNTQILIKKEQDHEQRGKIQQPTHERGRRNCGSNGTVATVFSYQRTERTRSRTPGIRGLAGPNKSNFGCLGCQPPSPHQNRLRELSQLGVVQLAHGRKMLLPRDVSGNLEQQRTQRNYGLRREIHRTGRVNTSLTPITKNVVKTKKRIK